MLAKAKENMEADRVDVDAWYRFADRVGKAVRCLPSLFARDNGHIVRAVEAIVKERDELKMEVAVLKGVREANKVRDENQDMIERDAEAKL
jgi:hypothetical protein